MFELDMHIEGCIRTIGFGAGSGRAEVVSQDLLIPPSEDKRMASGLFRLSAGHV